MAWPAAFIGREGELSRLMGALGGDTRLVLIVGDAGVGKTRFAEEGMSRAAATGMAMVRGECLPLTAMLPLLPVASALRELGKLDGGQLIESALATAPGFVRDEVRRLVPWLTSQEGEGGADAAERGEGWRRERMFTGLAELLAAVAIGSPSGFGLVVEDVHWADSETLDFLTFLSRAGRQQMVKVAVTCRSDETPLGNEVARWLAQVRGAAAVEEIRLGPLSRAEVAGQVAALTPRLVSSTVVDELFARAEGNPFFTEQLVAAALAGDTADERLRIPAELPARLADVLAARWGRCAGEARALLNAMAIVGRTVDEDLLSTLTGLDVEATRRGLRELADARLLADDTPGSGHRLRHALLAEAVAAGLLPGQCAASHERTAQALAAAGDEGLAAEIAGHWRAAAPAREFPARVTAARAAERIFGYAEAAGHWQRLIELWPEVPDAASVAGIGLPQVYVRAIDAIRLSGDREYARELAEESYRRFAGHQDPATAAIACYRAAFFRLFNAPAAARPRLEEALRLFELARPSAESTAARFDYAISFRGSAGSLTDVSALLNRALETAEAAGATAFIPRILAALAHAAFQSGQVEEGQALLDRGRVLAQAAHDGETLLWHEIAASEVLFRRGRFLDAAEAAVRGIEAARQAGLGASWEAGNLAYNATEALLALGRTAQAAALLGAPATGPPDLDHWMGQEARAEVYLLRGDIETARRRHQQVMALVGYVGNIELSRELAQRGAELALWAEAPRDAIEEIKRVLGLFHAPDWSIMCGRLLTAGMRACADLAGQARARRAWADAEDAVAIADDLVRWVAQMDYVPLTDHPYVAAIPAERATWEAERARLRGEDDPEAWSVAAKTWDGMCCPHRAGYAWWRQAQAQLDAGQPATAAAGTLRAAAAAADGHEPLLAQIRSLAERARVPLHATTAVTPPAKYVEPLARYGLTGRELAVLRLVAAGRSNAQIGAELYISPRTAGVHVSNILRKLGVDGRVQAATLAERAGLLDT